MILRIIFGFGIFVGGLGFAGTQEELLKAAAEDPNFNVSQLEFHEGALTVASWQKISRFIDKHSTLSVPDLAHDLAALPPELGLRFAIHLFRNPYDNAASILRGIDPHGEKLSVLVRGAPTTFAGEVEDRLKYPPRQELKRFLTDPRAVSDADLIQRILPQILEESRGRGAAAPRLEAIKDPTVVQAVVDSVLGDENASRWIEILRSELDADHPIVLGVRSHIRDEKLPEKTRIALFAGTGIRNEDDIDYLWQLALKEPNSKLGEAAYFGVVWNVPRSRAFPLAEQMIQLVAEGDSPYRRGIQALIDLEKPKPEASKKPPLQKNALFQSLKCGWSRLFGRR